MARGTSAYHVCDGARATARRAAALGIATVAAMAVVPGIASPRAALTASAASDSAAAAGSGASLGYFSAPFEQAGPRCDEATTQAKPCKPAGSSIVVLADGRVLYWNALEGTEKVNTNTVTQYSQVAANDQSRILDLRSGTPTWSTPSPADAGARETNATMVPAPLTSGQTAGSGSLFCSDQAQLADGRVLAVGGTDYYLEPKVPGVPEGVSELQGLRNGRVFDPATNKWVQSGAMSYGRWYPALVTLADGKVFVASGVTKLIKPMYTGLPGSGGQNITDSGTNVKETETYDPATGKWTVNGPGGSTDPSSKSLPLFPRLHLLPDGKVFYDGAGQTFNPDGQSYDEALWNIDSAYDPATHSWTDLGVPGVGTTFPGFRGSGFSVALPLTAPYTSASFLSAGGVAGVTPGTWRATNSSEINTVDVSHGDKLTTAATGNLTRPRWYSTGVALPDGSVVAFSGATVDEVDTPGMGKAITQAERFDPVTKTWSPLATAHRGRTYHNAAILLPDGRVLVGGHAPIPTMYGYEQTVPGGYSNNERDPSFEVFTPPYLTWGIPQPVISGLSAQSLGYGSTLAIGTSDAASIGSVVLMRNNAITHLVDGDQRTVQLQITGRTGGAISVALPANHAVLPPGPYELFINRSTPKGLVPSLAREVFVGAPVPAWVPAAPPLSGAAINTGAAPAQPAQQGSVGEVQQRGEHAAKAAVAEALGKPTPKADAARLDARGAAVAARVIGPGPSAGIAVMIGAMAGLAAARAVRRRRR